VSAGERRLPQGGRGGDDRADFVVAV